MVSLMSYAIVLRIVWQFRRDAFDKEGLMGCEPKSLLKGRSSGGLMASGATGIIHRSTGRANIKGSAYM